MSKDPDRRPAPRGAVSPLRRKLGVELRRFRVAAGLSAAEAAEKLALSASTISRAETGSVSVHPRDVDAMVRLYGLVDDRTRDLLLALARRSRKRGWWHAYRDVLPPDVLDFIRVEDGANSIRSFQTMLVPGFLQTPAYSHAVAAVFPRNDPPEIAQRLIEVRGRRQQLLEDPNPVPVHVILDESLLHRRIGGPGVMRGQLERLLELADRDNVTLQVLSEQGAHVGLGGPFTLFGFPEPMDELAIAHIENQRFFLLADDEHDIRHYETVFHQVQRSALPVSDSLAVLKELAWWA